MTPAVDLTWTNLEDLHDVICRRAFHADFNVHVAASDLPDLALDDITVVQDLRFHGGNVVTSSMVKMPFRLFLMIHPAPPRESTRDGGRGPATKRCDDEAIVDELPWVKDYMTKRSLQSRCGTPVTFPVADHDTESGTSGLDGDAGDTYGDLDFDEISRLLREKRHELAAADGGSADDDFVVQVLGGACSMRDTGEVVHGVRAIARNDIAKDFCDHRNVC